MAVLPTVQSFGQRPSSRSPRQVIPFRADIAQSAEATAFRQLAKSTPLKAIADVAAGFAEQFAEENAAREARDILTEYSDAVLVLMRGDGTDAVPGYLNTLGLNAVNGKEAHIQGLEALRDAARARVSSPAVQALITDKIDTRHRTSINSSAVHFGTERVVANDASFDARQASIAREAFANPDLAPKFADEAGDVAAEQAITRGLDPAEAFKEASTEIHISEIKRLAVTDPDAARRYFNIYNAGIDDLKNIEIEKILAVAEKRSLAAEKEQRLAQERAEKAAEDVLKLAQDETKDGFLERLFGGVEAPLTYRDILDSNLDPTSQERYIRLLDAELETQPTFETQKNVYNEV